MATSKESTTDKTATDASASSPNVKTPQDVYFVPEVGAVKAPSAEAAVTKANKLKESN